MGFSRQEYGSECHALLQGIFLTQELKPGLLRLLHWQAGFFTTSCLQRPFPQVCSSESVLNCLRPSFISQVSPPLFLPQQSLPTAAFLALRCQGRSQGEGGPLLGTLSLG